MRFADAQALAWQDPWPSEMKIATTVDDEFLLQYLFFRASYGLLSSTPIPELEPDPPPSVRHLSRLQRAEWDAAWEQGWRDLWAWRSRRDTCRNTGTLQGLFTRIGKPPLWPMERGAYFDREAFASWKETLIDADRSRAARERPENRFVAELASAWRRGLHEIVVLPYRGEFYRSVGGFALELSRTSYLSPTSFPAALSEFGASRLRLSS